MAMDEAKFTETTQGIDLSDKEKAILRRQFGLPYDESLIDNDVTLQKRLLWKAAAKLPKPEKA